VAAIGCGVHHNAWLTRQLLDTGSLDFLEAWLGKQAFQPWENRIISCLKKTER
jgi:hypothetical protein